MRGDGPRWATRGVSHRKFGAASPEESSMMILAGQKWTQCCSRKRQSCLWDVASRSVVERVACAVVSVS